MNGLLMIVSGPSGVGKDTLLDAWREIDPEVERVVAATTRAPRTGEQDGIDYHFLTAESFRDMIEKGEFLEWKEVHGNLYGTPLASVESLLAAGKTAILKIDVQGALDVMEIRPDAITVMIVPPSLEELEARIRGRATDSPEVIATRLKNALGELALAPRYQHQVVNSKVEIAVSELMRIKESSWQMSS